MSKDYSISLDTQRTILQTIYLKNLFILGVNSSVVLNSMDDIFIFKKTAVLPFLFHRYDISLKHFCMKTISDNSRPSQASKLSDIFHAELFSAYIYVYLLQQLINVTIRILSFCPWKVYQIRKVASFGKVIQGSVSRQQMQKLCQRKVVEIIT